jgi:hypothetical protein
MGKAKALAEDRGCLDGAAILGGKKVGASQHDALNGCGEPFVGQIAGAS